MDTCKQLYHNLLELYDPVFLAGGCLHHLATTVFPFYLVDAGQRDIGEAGSHNVVLMAKVQIPELFS